MKVEEAIEGERRKCSGCRPALPGAGMSDRSSDERIEIDGVLTRAEFDGILAAALAQTPPEESERALFMVDVRGVARISRALGYAVSDDLLAELAARLVATAGSTTIAHYGEDRFVILREGLADRQEVTELARRLIETVHMPRLVSGLRTRLAASIGVVIPPRRPVGGEEVMREAAAATAAAAKVRPQSLRGLLPGDADQAGQPPAARGRTRPRPAAGRVRSPLPADRRRRRQPADGDRGADPLAPSRARPGAARPLPAGRRGERADQRSRRLDADRGLRADRPLAARRPRPGLPAGLDQHLDVAALRRHPRRARSRRRSPRPACRPRRCCWRSPSRRRWSCARRRWKRWPS